MLHFRLLRADEIDVRVSTVKQKGCSLLLYKDARVDQNILDETFGVFGWQRSHQMIGDNLYCTVSVKNPETGEWISKQDVGTESYTEKEKGQASDSFKRACFNLGIGRELYTAPFIWVPADKCEIKSINGKFTTYDRFSVRAIEYTDAGTIKYLQIANDSRNEIVYTFGRKATTKKQAKQDPEMAEDNAPEKAQKEPQVKYISPDHVVQAKLVCRNHGMPESVLCDRYGRKKIEEFTLDDWKDFCKTGNEFLNEWDKQHEDARTA